MNNQQQMKPKGTWDALRRIKIPALGHAADAMAIERVIDALPGVRGVDADAEKRLVTVLYDATVLDYRAIESELENTGFPSLDNWWSRFKARCYQYSDTNARENAAARPSACCNKPPK